MDDEFYRKHIWNGHPPACTCVACVDRHLGRGQPQERGRESVNRPTDRTSTSRNPTPVPSRTSSRIASSDRGGGREQGGTRTLLAVIILAGIITSAIALPMWLSRNSPTGNSAPPTDPVPPPQAAVPIPSPAPTQSLTATPTQQPTVPPLMVVPPPTMLAAPTVAVPTATPVPTPTAAQIPTLTVPQIFPLLDQGKITAEEAARMLQGALPSGENSSNAETATVNPTPTSYGTNGHSGHRDYSVACFATPRRQELHAGTHQR